MTRSFDFPPTYTFEIDHAEPLKPIGYLPTDKELAAQNRKQKIIDNWRKICNNLNRNKTGE